MRKLFIICLLSLSLFGCSNQSINNSNNHQTPVETENVNSSLPSDIIVIFEKEDAELLKEFIESKPEIFRNINYEEGKLICEISESNFDKAMKLLEEAKENVN